jgi:hypothetical protein
MPALSSPELANLPSAGSISRRWKYTLAKAPLRPSLRGLYANEISRFLRYCEILRAPVTSARAREYVRIVPLARCRPVAREALRWFFHTGLNRIAPSHRTRPVARRIAIWPAA